MNKFRIISSLPLLLLSACAVEPADGVGNSSGSARPAIDRGALTNDVSASITCNGNRLTAESDMLVLGLTDSSTLVDIYDVQERVDAVAAAFEACGDPRGLFPTVYRPITDRAVEAIEEGRFEHGDWVRDLVIDFASRYLDNLRDEILYTSPSWAWDRYYELAARDDVSLTRVAAMGIVVHLGVDLPWCLVEIGTEETHKDDFYLFGDVLVEVSDVIIADLYAYYGADSEDLFTGFFMGDWVDSAFGQDTTTAFAFQTIRTKAWNNRWYLQQWWGAWIAESEIYTSFWALDGVLAGLDASGTI